MSSEKSTHAGKYVLVIHGGAGTMKRSQTTPDKERAYHSALRAALEAGYAVLSQGGEALDAAVAAVSSMENDPLFNSGRGAVFTTEGKNELEASVMLSKPPAGSEVPKARRGASLTLLSKIANPSQLARAIYLNPSLCPHPFISGTHAETLASKELGFDLKDPSYFFSRKRWEEHRRGLGLPVDLPEDDGSHDDDLSTNPQGTVGAVALDIRGCICAVTSTGGRTNKLPGRIGDTPHMGAGYWAEEWTQPKDSRGFWQWLVGKPGQEKKAIGISGTGNGDYFIRQATGVSMTNHLKATGRSLQEAAEFATTALKDEDEHYGSPDADGGIIALDEDGNIAMALNCEGMYRGFVKNDGVIKTAIFADDIPEAHPVWQEKY